MNCPEIAWEVDDLLQNRDAWWVPGKIVEFENGCCRVATYDAPNRDVVMLDATLEKFSEPRWKRSIVSRRR